MTTQISRRLLRRDELQSTLNLPEPKIEWLINTHQIRPLLLCGEERFDSREVDQLIETYRQISTRKESND